MVHRLCTYGKKLARQRGDDLTYFPKKIIIIKTENVYDPNDECFFVRAETYLYFIYFIIYLSKQPSLL